MSCLIDFLVFLSGLCVCIELECSAYTEDGKYRKIPYSGGIMATLLKFKSQVKVSNKGLSDRFRVGFVRGQ